MKIELLSNKSFETKIDSKVFIQLGSFGEIRDSVINPPINLNAMSLITRCVLGKYFNIGLYSYIADAQVGRYCTFASRCSIGAFAHPTDWLSVHEFQYRDTLDIWGETIHDRGVNLLRERGTQTFIGNDVWIGDNAVIMRGVTIGDGVIIGASSVVTKSIPPYMIVAGNPARVMRPRFSEGVISQLHELRWWDLDISDLCGVNFSDIVEAINQIVALKKNRRVSE